MINFENIEQVRIDNFKGGNGYILAKTFFDGKVRVMQAILEKGCSIGKHSHETSLEIIYVLEGELKVVVNGEIKIVKAGECHYCQNGSEHEVINNLETPLKMLCIVPEINL